LPVPYFDPQNKRAKPVTNGKAGKAIGWRMYFCRENACLPFVDKRFP
jgi:hypothetical protein